MILASFTPWLPSGDDLRLFSPELVLVGTIVLLLVLPLLVGRRAHLPALIVLAGTLVGLFATAALVGFVPNGGVGALTPPSARAMLFADRFSVFFKMFLLLLLALITWLWLVGTTHPECRDREERGHGAVEFFVLLLTSAVGMLLMVSTLNLLVMIVAIETALLPSYAIVASDKRSRLGAEAALKYVMFGAASAAIMVYGVSLLYGQFGTLDLGAIAVQVRQSPQSGVVGGGIVFWLALAALGVGIAFKIAAVPVHLWCPDVFQGAPIEVTTWLSIASKAAGLGLLLRIVDVFTGVGGSAMQPLAWGIASVAAITCTVGNLAALRQDSVKRVLAYSSIAHAGYMMMAAAILVRPSGSAIDPAVHVGTSAVIAYLFVYVTMNVGAFGATALVVWHTGSDHISAFTGLGRRAPWLALPMAVCLFSLVGLPPLGGFAAKWFLLVALGKSAAAAPWLWTLVVIAVINTAISLYYYVRIIRQMYLTDDGVQPAFGVPAGGLIVVNTCAVLLVLLGTVWFSALGDRAEVLAAYLYP
jgi:NADH-quinone oxidoreductase subunit N